MYRPPGPSSTFFSEFPDILYSMASIPDDLVLKGDFGLHIDSISSNARQLIGILETFDMNQYINFPSHIHGHSLALIFCQKCDVLSVSSPDKISDHVSVVANLNMPPSHSDYCTVPNISSTGS